MVGRFIKMGYFISYYSLHVIATKQSEFGQTFHKDGIFYKLLLCCPFENVCESWLIKIDFGRPNAEIGWKMANG